MNKTLVSYVLKLPRITRIFLSGLFSLAVTLVVSLVADSILSATVPEDTKVVILTMIAGGLGIIMYALGYFFIVGIIGEDVVARRATGFYILLGLFAIFLVVLWILGLIINGS
ncbi:MAG: hypothetical protein Kow00117_04080 [Phototrophicales bacterium]